MFSKACEREYIIFPTSFFSTQEIEFLTKTQASKPASNEYLFACVFRLIESYFDEISKVGTRHLKSIPTVKKCYTTHLKNPALLNPLVTKCLKIINGKGSIFSGI